ncbi:MAG: hypothetical protein HYT93_02525 [Parcubacteria group bacterium]|nr:hypothetical protein [Parcubacteria group bacterium]
MTQKAEIEIKKLEQLADGPDGVRLLLEYKNTMRLKRDWNGICGVECLHISKYLDKLINLKKKTVSISDML